MQIYKVGGAVRDRLLGRPVTEIDWVVVGASAEDMVALGYRPVGADFPVFLHPQTGEEYALARTERKSGRGYGGFTFHASPEVTLEEDLLRRDLTINAMAEDDHGQVIDPYGGLRDLQARVLRHAAPAFAEDPLRVLRVARFAARYAPLGFTVAPETLGLMRQLSESGELRDLTPERSWKEISRALMEPRPDVFVQVLHDCAALAELLPEVDTHMAGQGEALLAALRACAEHEQPLTVRWACLLLNTEPEQIATINSRCKAPRDCAELALLTRQQRGAWHEALELSAEALLALLQSFDVYRRPQRFEQFLGACEMAARGAGQYREFPQTAFLLGAADCARNQAIQPLLEQGFQGAALGDALTRQRLEALREYRTARH
jgi:tRNA nucleotidyltransferase (CCA-adding enzyme)